ncbi:MAG: DNA polymerase IV [Oscillospiraceae bacterium]
MTRTILHCDLNNFFASVECHDNPRLNDIPIAVCGSQDDRHGIVLAKNQHAKVYGIKTGETIWQAKQKCRNLEIVPPHFERYYYFSKRAREVYSRYTDQIEPFGIDECWLDVTGSTGIFGDGKTIADKIREDMKAELGLTISVGVSFNKIFAKLGSDLKKPDGTTIIEKDTFKKIVWELPCEDLLGVGKATQRRLNSVGIYTIGEIADATPQRLFHMFGKSGYNLWQNAMGLDCSNVSHQDFQYDAKSVGNSTTCKYDLENSEQVWQVLMSLSEEVSRRLRKDNLVAANVVISIKDNLLNYCEHGMPLHSPTRSCEVISKSAMELFNKNWEWQRDVRALGVRATNLTHYDNGVQTSLFVDRGDELSKEKLETTVDLLRTRFGKTAIQRAALMLPNHMPTGNTTQEVHMPTFNSR